MKRLILASLSAQTLKVEGRSMRSCEVKQTKSQCTFLSAFSETLIIEENTLYPSGGFIWTQMLCVQLRMHVACASDEGPWSEKLILLMYRDSFFSQTFKMLNTTTSTHTTLLYHALHSLIIHLHLHRLTSDSDWSCGLVCAISSTITLVYNVYTA